MQKKVNYVGIRLKNERHRLSYRLNNVSDLCGVTDKTFSRWEAGSPIPSDKLLALEPLGFDIYYVLTGGRLGSELEDASKNAETIEKTKSYTDSEQEILTRNPVPSFEQQLGTSNDSINKNIEPVSISRVAELGKDFFNAWDNLFYTHGSEMQTAIMTALKGPDIAHTLVSSQFKGSVAKDKRHDILALDESKKR